MDRKLFISATPRLNLLPCCSQSVIDVGGHYPGWVQPATAFFQPGTDLHRQGLIPAVEGPLDHRGFFCFGGEMGQKRMGRKQAARLKLWEEIFAYFFKRGVHHWGGGRQAVVEWSAPLDHWGGTMLEPPEDRMPGMPAQPPPPGNGLGRNLGLMRLGQEFAKCFNTGGVYWCLAKKMKSAKEPLKVQD